MREKRYFDRTLMKLPLIVNLKKDNAVLEAEINDLGAKGLGIFSKGKIPSEGEVKLRVEVPEKKNYINMSGNVIWSKEYFPDGWRAGVALKEQSIDLVAFSVLQDM